MIMRFDSPRERISEVSRRRVRHRSISKGMTTNAVEGSILKDDRRSCSFYILLRPPTIKVIIECSLKMRDVKYSRTSTWT